MIRVRDIAALALDVRAAARVGLTILTAPARDLFAAFASAGDEALVEVEDVEWPLPEASERWGRTFGGEVG